MKCYRDGGCGPYEMYSCSECPASKPDYKKVKDHPPYLDYPKERKKQTNVEKYFRNATDEEIASFLAAVNNHRQWSEQTLMQDLDADYAYYLDWLKQEVESDG